MEGVFDLSLKSVYSLRVKKETFFLIVMIASVGLLNSGTIRRKPDPVVKTQTDPISYKQKMEETKDGVKGAPLPSFKLFPKENFMADPSVGEAQEETPQDPSSQESVSEVPVSEEEESEEWWNDDTKEDPPASAETSNESVASQEP